MSAPRRPRGPERPGVYLEEPDGALTLVHAYREDALDYALEDVPELLGVGQWQEGEPPRLTLAARDLRGLAAQADARAFDLEEDLVALCRDLREATRGRPGSAFVFLDFP